MFLIPSSELARAALISDEKALESGLTFIQLAALRDVQEFGARCLAARDDYRTLRVWIAKRGELQAFSESGWKQSRRVPRATLSTLKALEAAGFLVPVKKEGRLARVKGVFHLSPSTWKRLEAWGRAEGYLEPETSSVAQAQGESLKDLSVQKIDSAVIQQDLFSQTFAQQGLFA